MGPSQTRAETTSAHGAPADCAHWCTRGAYTSTACRYLANVHRTPHTPRHVLFGNLPMEARGRAKREPQGGGKRASRTGASDRGILAVATGKSTTLRSASFAQGAEVCMSFSGLTSRAVWRVHFMVILGRRADADTGDAGAQRFRTRSK